MATTTLDPFTVRSLTEDGELISETEPMDEDNAMAIFDDILENAEAGVVVQLIALDGSIDTEELVVGCNSPRYGRHSNGISPALS